MKPFPDLCHLLLETQAMLDFRRAVNLCHLLMQCETIPGDVVELGCHKGKTAVLMAAITSKKLWLVDSFDGLPEPSPQDAGCVDYFVRGHLRSSQEDVINTFTDAHLPLPNIIPKWFKDVKPLDLPSYIAFAHLDGDLYESIYESLFLVWTRMSVNGIIVIDDFKNPNLPGVTKAVRDFLAGANRPSQIEIPDQTAQCWLRIKG